MSVGTLFVAFLLLMLSQLVLGFLEEYRKETVHRPVWAVCTAGAGEEDGGGSRALFDGGPAPADDGTVLET